MLHELARQVKGEIAREAVDELAMARDLAEELARREAELAELKQGQSPSGSPGDQQGKDGKDGKGKDGKGKDGKDGKGKDGKEGQGEGTKPGQGQGGVGAWDGLSEAEQVDRMAEMARTLEAWLKQIDKQGEGKAADAVGEILDKGNISEIVERAERMGDLRVGGKKQELGREARELATKLEVLGQALELLHRGIVAPQLAAMVEFDRRMAELLEKLATLKTEAEVAAWKRARWRPCCATSRKPRSRERPSWPTPSASAEAGTGTMRIATYLLQTRLPGRSEASRSRSRNGSKT